MSDDVDNNNAEPDLGVLQRPLTPLQYELLETVWIPAGRGLYNGIPPVWPVWDYVARTLESRHPDLDDAVDVLNSLPRLARTTQFHEHPYGLVWRTSQPDIRPAPDQRIGLSIAGLAALASAGMTQPKTADEYAAIIGQLATWDSQMEGRPDEVAKQNRPLSLFTSWLTTPTAEKPTKIPDRISAQLLQKEYAPVVVFPLDAEDGHQAQIGRISLRAYRTVRTAADYLRIIDVAEAERTPPPQYRSPLTLVQTFDYLSLVLNADKTWKVGHLTSAPDLQSAAAVSATVHDEPTYQAALTGLCTVIDQMTVPPIPTYDLDAMAGDQERSEAQATINRLERWVTRRVGNDGDLERIRHAVRFIRNIRALRVEGQHRSASKIATATKARHNLGLPDTIDDYPKAWVHIQDTLAGALDVIRQEVQAAGRTGL